MRLPKELVSHITFDSLRRVGGGGWKRREEMASPMVLLFVVLCCDYGSIRLFVPRSDWRVNDADWIVLFVMRVRGMANN